VHTVRDNSDRTEESAKC